MASKEVLLRGMIKRIGNGTNTNIWQDRWIPNHFDAHPLTPPADQDVTMVSELLTETGEWDESLIRQVFIPIDADAILRIPLRIQEDDRWAWEPEKHGEFSVKSAYRKLAAVHEQVDSAAPGGSGDDSWARIWKLDVPPKVKVFWWRVLHEFLPTKAVLNHRHIEPTAFCEMCGAEKETIRHVLVECTMARQFWREIKLLTGVKLPNLHERRSGAFSPLVCTPSGCREINDGMGIAKCR